MRDRKDRGEHQASTSNSNTSLAQSMWRWIIICAFYIPLWLLLAILDVALIQIVIEYQRPLWFVLLNFIPVVISLLSVAISIAKLRRIELSVAPNMQMLEVALISAALLIATLLGIFMWLVIFATPII